MIKTKRQMFIIIGAFILVLLLGTTTYAFFNYTRTGTGNVIKTGRIAFNTEQGNAINLTNLFPINPEETGIMNDATKVGTVTINVTGDTTYTNGTEYLVSAVNVTNTIGNKSLPISINVSVENNSENNPATSLGILDEDYFTDRGATTESSIYKVLAGDVISEGDKLVVGYIKSGAEGVDGNIVIKAYIDEDKVLISDTYPAEVTDTNSDGYIDGTLASLGEGKTVFTTTEWNSLQANSISFKIKVEANEGVWVKYKPVNKCSTGNVALSNGEQYNNGQYKYTYYTNYGWSVELSDKNSTSPVTTKLCTSINDEPIVSFYQMFLNSKTTNIDLSSFDSSNVVDMRSMFEGVDLQSIDVSFLDTQNVNYMQNMFRNAKISNLDLSSLDTKSVNTMQAMFYGSTIDSLSLDNLNVANVNNVISMFERSEISNLSFGTTFNLDSVTSMESMFQSATIPTIDLSAFKTDSLESMYHAFDNCETNSIIFGNNFNTQNVTNMSYAFSQINTSTLDLSSFNTSAVTNMGNMFKNSTQLTTIKVSSLWNTNNVSLSPDMFYNSIYLVGGASTTYDLNHVDKTYAHIDGGPSNPGYLTLKTN